MIIHFIVTFVVLLVLLATMWGALELFTFLVDEYPRFAMLLTVAAVALVMTLTAGCAPKPLKPLPAPPASVKEVLVPVKVPCVVKKPQTGPKAIDGEAILTKDLFGTVQDLLADTLDLRSDQDKADAAMTDPCGKAPA